MITRILVPLDGSQLAERALVVASDLAERLGATLVLARVVPPFTPARYAPELARQVEEADAKDARAYLTSLAERLASERVAIESRFLKGRVADSLAEQATTDACELIVMTSHGVGGLASTVFGSVAQKLLHMAPCPVLVVRPTAADLEGEEESEERRADQALINEAGRLAAEATAERG